MSKIKELTAIGCTLIFLLLAAGSASKKAVVYNIELQSVNAPIDKSKTYGEKKVVNVTNNMSYSDEYIVIAWNIDLKTLGFSLKNVSNHPIKIYWDDITYVNTDGNAYRVTHNGVRYIESDKSQASILIPSGASISDHLLPTEKISYVSGNYGGWREEPLLPAYYKDEKDFESAVNLYMGKTLGILLPIEIEGIRNDYYFMFRVADAIIPEQIKKQTKK